MGKVLELEPFLKGWEGVAQCFRVSTGFSRAGKELGKVFELEQVFEVQLPLKLPLRLSLRFPLRLPVRLPLRFPLGLPLELEQVFEGLGRS